MKQTLLLTLSFMLFYQINAQEGRKAYIGIQIGATQSKILNDREFDHFIQSRSKTNLSYGISYLHFFNDIFGIEAQLNYRNIGTSYEDIYGDGINDNEKVDFSTDLKYINIPISAIISPFRTEYFHITGGFYISNLISAKQNGDLDGYNNDFFTVRIERDLTEYTSNWDIGLTSGIGSRIKINDNLNLGFDLKYNFSLVDLNESYPNDNTNYKNNYFSIDFGLDFLID